MIVFEIICNVAYLCQGQPVSLRCWPLTCNLKKCNSLRSSFGMHNLERQLRYWHLLTRHCPCNLLPRPTSPKHEYRETLRPPCDVIDDVITIKTVFGIIWDDLIIFEVKLKLCLIFQKFQNGRHFEPDKLLFTGIYTGSWIYQKDSHEHLRYFELLIDAVSQILTEIYQFQNLTYSVTWWRHQWGCEYLFI